MRYRNYVILFILTLFLTNTGVAQEPRYRVELIVLTHLDRSEEPREFSQIPDYSNATDFLTPVVEEEFEDENEGETPDDSASPDEEAIELTAEESEVEEDPNRLVHIEEMSDVMQESWRRLRLSAPFRPEIYLSWEQGSEEPFPSLRVHDLETVMVDDPWSEHRTIEPEQAIELTDMMGPPLPDPTFYYRLDGTASLKRSRFLHLEFDLQLREALWDPAVTLGLARDPVDDSGGVETRRPSSFLVHSMKQSRQVRSGRMEYFDGPVLGVLAYISAIRVEEEADP